MAPHGCYPCVGEDHWVTISVRTDDEWRALREVAGVADDSRFSTAESRLAHEDELDALVAAWTSSLDRYEAARRLQARGIPAAPVLDCGADTYDDPHLQERGYFQKVTHPDAGTHVLSGPIWRLAGVEGPVQRPAPCLGEHNRHVLRDMLGMPESALSRREEQDIIGTVPLQGSDMGGVRRVARQDRARAGTRSSSPRPPRGA
jgi:crotonobetainyl-CoA:carnitine CoA-transferase CaiB-like acyl-CoA transferase